MAIVKRFAGPGAGFLAGTGLELSGYENSGIGVGLIVLAAVWAGFAIVTLGPVRRAPKRFVAHLQKRTDSQAKVANAEPRSPAGGGSYLSVISRPPEPRTAQLTIRVLQPPASGGFDGHGMVYLPEVEVINGSDKLFVFKFELNSGNQLLGTSPYRTIRAEADQSVRDAYLPNPLDAPKGSLYGKLGFVPAEGQELPHPTDCYELHVTDETTGIKYKFKIPTSEQGIQFPER